MSALIVCTAAGGAYCDECGDRITGEVYGPASDGSYAVALPWSWHRSPSDRIWTHGRRRHAPAPGSRATRRLSSSQAVQVRDHVRCPGCRALLTPPA
jgi:ribosomal protein L37AE/L43A